MTTRMERDSLGELPVGAGSYAGIHTARARLNFDLPAPPAKRCLVEAMLVVKRAAALANGQASLLSPEKAEAIAAACEDLMGGLAAEDLQTNSLQGGAGTSLNMNVNECVANRAIERLGGQKGDYDLIHPLNDVNRSQSTNDVVPTALRIAAIGLIRQLADALARLQEALQAKEQEFDAVARLGRTELMDALPMRVGQGFGAYAQAVARDRWRIYKCEERLRVVPIGGTAIGTGLNAPPAYTFRLTELLQRATGLGLARAESPMDAIQNADVFVEASGLLKACAATLLKLCGDLRLLASGPAGGLGELALPAVQAGSSIMPGKVNPVIPEMVTQVALRVIAHDGAITSAAAMGQLELNAFLPLIADSLLDMLELLCAAVPLLTDRCIAGITVDEERCREHLEHSTAAAAVLIAHLGYDRAAELAHLAQQSGRTLRETVLAESGLPADTVEHIFSLNELTRPGLPGVK